MGLGWNIPQGIYLSVAMDGATNTIPSGYPSGMLHCASGAPVVRVGMWGL